MTLLTGKMLQRQFTYRWSKKFKYLSLALKNAYKVLKIKYNSINRRFSEYGSVF